MGVSGLFQQSLMVHSRENEACYCCGSKILKKKVNGRGTYYCPICQKPEPIVVAITGCMGSENRSNRLFNSKGYKTVSSDNINAQLQNKTRQF